MSETPKTDAAVLEASQYYQPLYPSINGRNQAVHASFARELESQVRELKQLCRRTMDAETALRDALRPFARVAGGIPYNWPSECILRFDQREDGSIYLSYHGINDASGGLTIGQWRALLSATEL